MTEHFASVEHNSCLFSIGFGLLCFVISFFIQPDVNPQSIPLRLFLVLCTGWLQVSGFRFDWFNGLCKSFVIGQSIHVVNRGDY